MALQLSNTLGQAVQRFYAIAAPTQTGQGRVNSLIELKNGELISGGYDGSLQRFSLPAVAKAACLGLDLANDPVTFETAVGHAALETCKKLGAS